MVSDNNSNSITPIWDLLFVERKESKGEFVENKIHDYYGSVYSNEIVLVLPKNWWIMFNGWCQGKFNCDATEIDNIASKFADYMYSRKYWR